MGRARLPKSMSALDFGQALTPKRIERLSQRARLAYADILEAASRQKEHTYRAYLMHEQMLLMLYMQRNPKMRWLADPLARWRTTWRFFGMVALLCNCIALTFAYWGRYRCEADPLCDVAERSCPSFNSLTELPNLLAPGTEAGCRRELLSGASAITVQLFSLAELALGFRTATTMRTASASPSFASPSSAYASSLYTLVHSGLHYGTTSGGAAAPLLLLDLLLIAPWHSDSLPDLRLPDLRSLLRAQPAAGSQLSRPNPAHPRQWLVFLRRKLRENKAWRTVIGYRRLTALPPAPAPLQFLIDRALVPLIVGEETLANQLRVLPAVGDAILEAELLQAFAASFLASAKMWVLFASALKAARVRRRLRSLRRQRAAQRIATGVMQWRIRTRVAALQRRHAAGARTVAVLVDALRRREPSRAGGDWDKDVWERDAGWERDGWEKNGWDINDGGSPRLWRRRGGDGGFDGFVTWDGSPHRLQRNTVSLPLRLWACSSLSRMPSSASQRESRDSRVANA